MKAFFIAILASLAGATLVPAGVSAQESACGVYCEQIPSGGGNTDPSGNGTSPGGNGNSTGGGGTNPGDANTGGPDSQSTGGTADSGSGDGVVPTAAEGGTESTTGGSAAEGSSEQETSSGLSRDGTQSKGERRQVGDDSTSQVQDDVDDVAAIAGNSDGYGGSSGIGIGLPILLAVLLAGALGAGLARRTGSMLSD